MWHKNSDKSEGSSSKPSQQCAAATTTRAVIGRSRHREAVVDHEDIGEEADFSDHSSDTTPGAVFVAGTSRQRTRATVGRVERAITPPRTHQESSPRAPRQNRQTDGRVSHRRVERDVTPPRAPRDIRHQALYQPHRSTSIAASATGPSVGTSQTTPPSPGGSANHRLRKNLADMEEKQRRYEEHGYRNNNNESTEVGIGVTESFIARMPEAQVHVGAETANAGLGLVTATLVENEDELAERMKAKEAELLQQLAVKDEELKAKEAQLRKYAASASGGGTGTQKASSVASSEASGGAFMKHRILQRDEVKVGRLVASGSFNALWIVKSIKLDEQSYRWVPREHIQARQHLVHFTKSSNTKLLMKTLDANLDNKKRRLASKRLIYEAKLLVKLSGHPNIIEPVCIASADVIDFHFFFLLPKVEHTLYDCIAGNKWNKRQKGKPKFLYHQVKVAIDIAAAIDCLHSLNIMHSDLKPENIGFTSEGDCWKLCNLSKAQSLARKGRSSGKSSKPYNMDLKTSSLYHGTPPYAAPEVSQKMPCNIAIDTFGFAIVIWEITTVRLCFGRESKTMAAFTSAVVDEATHGSSWQRPEFDSDTPKGLQDIIQQCWHLEPSHRPRMKDVLDKLKAFQQTLSAIL